MEEWLDGAEMLQAFFQKKTGESGFPQRKAPVEDWIELVEMV